MSGKMEKQTKRAYAYLRVSGKGQVEGDDFERQVLTVRKYAVAHGIRIVEVFREEGVNGATDWDDREAFSAMMVQLLANGVRTVLVESLGRLARDLMVQESILADFRNKRLELISVTEPDLDSTDPTRVLMRQMLGSFHQYEKSMIVAKLKGARQRKRVREGYCEGRKAYGYREGELEVIGWIQTARRQDLTLQAIADKLNRKGVATRYGRQWSAKQISRVLERAEA